MTGFEQAKQIEKIYNDAMEKLSKLEVERKEVVNKYIKELETQKIDAVRASLELLFNKE